MNTILTARDLAAVRLFTSGKQNACSLQVEVVFAKLVVRNSHLVGAILKQIDM